MPERGEPRTLSRRQVVGLGLLGVSTVIGAGVGGQRGWEAWQGRDAGATPVPSASPADPIAAWRATGPPFYIAHRGAGIVLPEHSMEAYRAALDWGAQCLEISVGMTSDGVLICMHDLTYDRTTTLTGAVADQGSQVLKSGRIDITRLGPRWQGEGRPAIPLLEDVLTQIGPNAILCLEAKDDNAFTPLMEAADKNGLTNRIFAKLHLPSTARVAQAHARGTPVFLYAGSAADLEPGRLDPALASLDPARDVIVLPTSVEDGPISPAVVTSVVERGVPTWMHPVMRRSEAAQFRELGVQGFVTPDIGYLSGNAPAARADAWAGGALTSGELTRFPYSERFAMRWSDAGVLTLDIPGEPTYLMLGQLCPVAPPEGTYRIEVDVRFDKPQEKQHSFAIAFGYADDRYVGPDAGGGAGYRAVVHPTGRMALLADDSDGNRRVLDERDVEDIAAYGATSEPSPWARMAVSVEPGAVTVAWDGQEILRTDDRAYRGGYVHVGRTGAQGPVSLRRLQIS